MAETQPPSRPTPTELLTEFARAQLTGAELIEVNRQAAERAMSKSRDKDMER